jgi:hypothetical protein
MSASLIVLFAIYVPMWLIGFVWQFWVKHILRTAYPEEYGRIYSDSSQRKYGNDLRFAGYLITRKYTSLGDTAIVRHLDAFRIYLFAFFMVLILTGVFFFTEKNKLLKNSFSSPLRAVTSDACLASRTPAASALRGC